MAIIIDVPRRFIRFSSSIISVDVSGSRFPVGSSARIKNGSSTNFAIEYLDNGCTNCIVSLMMLFILLGWVIIYIRVSSHNDLSYWDQVEGQSHELNFR